MGFNFIKVLKTKYYSATMGFIDYKVYTGIDIDNDILKKISFGSNQKGICFVYECKDSLEEVQKARDFLKKIVGAIRLDFEQDTLSLNVTQDNTCSFRSLKEFNVKHLFVFGRTPSDLGIQAAIPMYKAMTINECAVFFADDLDNLIANQDKKRLLWNHLKSTFLPD